jgi:hypothetical protein
MSSLRVLVACEYSGRVRDAFKARGHYAMSCDLLPSEAPGHHYQGDVFELLALFRWDLMIAHPPCTHLCNSGARWWPGKAKEQAEALSFVRRLMDADVPRIAIENPPGKIGSAIRQADQYVQPWEHGHPETKKTGLWLKGLPHLLPTNDVHGHMMTLSISQRSRVHWMPPGPDRWKERSRTFSGIARAMADQWG